MLRERFLRGLAERLGGLGEGLAPAAAAFVEVEREGRRDLAQGGVEGVAAVRSGVHEDEVGGEGEDRLLGRLVVRADVHGSPERSGGGRGQGREALAEPDGADAGAGEPDGFDAEDGEQFGGFFLNDHDAFGRAGHRGGAEVVLDGSRRGGGGREHQGQGERHDGLGHRDLLIQI